MKGFLLILFALGCSVDTTGLGPASDSGARDANLPDGVLPDGVMRECAAGETRACESDLGACESGTQRCAAGAWDACEGGIGPSTEVCDPDNIDEDCDGMGNEGCPCVNGETQECGASARAPCMLGLATCVDGNWSTECVGAVLPQEETCNGINDDCDFATDEGVLTTFYQDNDGDGVGTGTTVEACALPADYASVGGDCNDNDREMSPMIAESCDGKDNNCNGTIDEGFPPTTYFLDDDDDGYGGSTMVSTCAAPPAGYIATGGDCNDAVASISPDAEETCDVIDNNCDGNKDDGGVCRGDCGTAEFGGHVYQFCNHDRNWDGAQGRCIDMGGNDSRFYELVTIENMAENTFLNTTARTYSTSKGWWFGLNDENNEGTFVWLSGSGASYRNWGADEPNNARNNEDCGQFRSDGKWNDAGCGENFWYVCEQSL